MDIENLSGQDMSDVEVHHNSAEPEKIGALAYAKGAHIHLGPGQDRHLPHEAWHVVQQKQGRVPVNAQFKALNGNDDQALEREADKFGELALQRKPVTSVSSSKALNSATPLRSVVQRLRRFWGSETEEENDDRQGHRTMWNPGKGRDLPDGIEDTGETAERKIFSRERKGLLGWSKISYKTYDMRQYRVTDGNKRFYMAIPENSRRKVMRSGKNVSRMNPIARGAAAYNVQGFNYFGEDLSIPATFGPMLPGAWGVIVFTLPVNTLMENDPEWPQGLRAQHNIPAEDIVEYMGQDEVEATMRERKRQQRQGLGL